MPYREFVIRKEHLERLDPLAESLYNFFREHYHVLADHTEKHGVDAPRAEFKGDLRIPSDVLQMWIAFKNKTISTPFAVRGTAHTFAERALKRGVLSEKTVSAPYEEHDIGGVAHYVVDPHAQGHDALKILGTYATILSAIDYAIEHARAALRSGEVAHPAVLIFPEHPINSAVSERRMDHILDHGSVPIPFFDEQGRLTFNNRIYAVAREARAEKGYLYPIDRHPVHYFRIEIPELLNGDLEDVKLRVAAKIFAHMLRP